MTSKRKASRHEHAKHEKSCEKHGLLKTCDDCKGCAKCKELIFTDTYMANRRSKQLKLKDREKSTSKQDEHEILCYKLPNVSSTPAKNPMICEPHPAPSVELRNGYLTHTCHCFKRNGLQSECPLSACQRNPKCIQHQYHQPSKIVKDFTSQKDEVPHRNNKTEFRAEFIEAYGNMLKQLVTGRPA